MARKGSYRFKGIEQVQRNLRAQLEKYKKVSISGLIKCAILIRRDMDNKPPLIPVDDGNLRNSWFVTAGSRTPTQGGEFQGVDAGSMGAQHSKVLASAKTRALSHKDPLVIIGFSAIYAGWVHERNWKLGKRPGSGPKFMESAMKRNVGPILSILANEMKK